MQTTAYLRGGCNFHQKDSLIDLQEAKNLDRFCVDKEFEICGVETLIKKQKLYIFSVYRSPDSDVKMFINKLDSLLNYACKNKNAKVILCGDFNIDQLSDSKHKNMLNDVLLSYQINNLVTVPTRVTNNTSSCIDYISTNIIKTNYVKCEVDFNGISDHSAQLLSLEIVSHVTKNNTTKRIFCNSGYDSLFLYLSRENWLDLYSANNVNDAFKIFSDTLNYYIELCFPVKRTTVHVKHSKSWITKGLKISSKKLKQLYHRSLHTSNENDKVFYMQYRRLYKKLIKKAKQMENDRILLNSSNIAKTTWNIINNNTNSKSNVTSINKISSANGNLITDSNEMANCFNDFFANVATKYNSDLTNDTFCTPTKYISTTFFMAPTDEIEVSNTIHNMKNSYSMGEDNLSINLLKKCVNFIIAPLTYIINYSFNEGIFPNILKIAKVIPIFKKGDNTVLENYRPISLLSTISKIMEKIVYARMILFIEKHNILNSAQHGFRKNKSTQSAVLDFLVSLYNNLDSNNKCIGIFMDLSKAFDLVDHALLLEKCFRYGFRGLVYNWIESYLSNRCQHVVINNSKSNARKMDCGVPQGSVLGPLLFLLFINDLPEIDTQNKLVMFADDNTYLCTGNNMNDCLNYVEYILKKFSSWFQNNKLHLNTSKTTFIHFTPKSGVMNSSHLVRINNKSLQQVQSTKFLGIYLDNKLNWETHINNLCPKLQSSCYALYRLKDLVSQSVLLMFYHAQFVSKIKYGIIFWGCSPHSVRVFYLQKKAIRTIYGLSNLTSCRDTFKANKLLTLPSLYIKEIIMYVKTNSNLFVNNNVYHDYDTRGKEDLCIPKHNLTISEKNPCYIGIKIYNKLPDYIKCLDNIKEFKHNVDIFLYTNVFYSLDEYFNH